MSHIAVTALQLVLHDWLAAICPAAVEPNPAGTHQLQDHAQPGTMYTWAWGLVQYLQRPAGCCRCPPPNLGLHCAGLHMVLQPMSTVAAAYMPTWHICILSAIARSCICQSVSNHRCCHCHSNWPADIAATAAITVFAAATAATSALGDEEWGHIVCRHLRALEKRASNASLAFKLYTESGVWVGGCPALCAVVCSAVCRL